jgi:predicted dehydrogenase
MTGEIKVACLGAGYFSQFHFDAWQRIPRATLVGIADRDPARLSDQGVPACPDLEALLERTRPDILDIIVPPQGHATSIRTALAHGVGTIICQKPFCTSLEEATAIADAAASAGATLVIHENFRFQPWYRRIATALSDGLVGEVHLATFRLRPGDGQGPDAYLDRQPYFQKMPRLLIHETAVHWIDTFRFLFGDPTGVYADLRRLNPVLAGEDAGVVLFDHPASVRAMFDGNRHLDHATDNLRRTMGEALIEGTHGTIALTGDGALHHRAFGTTAVTELKPPEVTTRFGGDCVHALQSHVVAAMLDGEPLENEARDYLTVLKIEDAIYRSAKSGRKIDLGDT